MPAGRRAGDRLPPPLLPGGQRLVPGQLTEQFRGHDTRVPFPPAGHLHPRERTSVVLTRGPDEPGIGHEVPAICVMSRAAPVDADVAIAAYTWSATLTARCRDTGRYDPSDASSAARRSESSAAGTSRDNGRRGMPMTTASPFSTSAIAPPAAASGATWHTDRPEVPPENRPSVLSAQLRPSPLPLRNEVGYSISCMPGPPRGPSYRMITTSPADT